MDRPGKKPVTSFRFKDRQMATISPWYRPLLMALAGFAVLTIFAGRNLPASETDLALKIETEDDVAGEVTATVAPWPKGEKIGRPRTISCPDRLMFDVHEFEDGQYLVRLSGQPFAGQWQQFKVA